MNDTWADRHAWVGEVTRDRAAKTGYPRVYKNAKYPKQSMEEFVDISKGYAFMERVDKTSVRFFHFDNLEDAERLISSRDKPTFSSVILRGRPVRLNIELDMENEKLDSIKANFDVKTMNALEKIKQENSPEDEHKLYAMWSVYFIRRAVMVVLDETYGHKYVSDRFRTASDHRLNKKSLRFYASLCFTSQQEYKHFISLVEKQLIKKNHGDLLSLIDPTSSMLRMPNNWKDDHMCAWNSPGTGFEFGVLTHTEDCITLDKQITEELTEDGHNDLNEQSEEVKQATTLALKHSALRGNFEFDKIDKHLILFKRIRPSLCPIHGRVHDTQGYAACIYKHHVYVYCSRGAVIDVDGKKKKIYAGFIGRKAAQSKLGARAIAKYVKKFDNMVKARDSKIIEIAASKTKELNDAKVAELIKQAEQQQQAVVDKKASALDEVMALYNTQKENATVFDDDKKFIWKDKRHLSGATIRGLDNIYNFVYHCVIKIEYSGDPVWATINEYRGQRRVTLLKNNPFVGTNDISVVVMNEDFDPMSDDPMKRIPSTEYSMFKISNDLRKKEFVERAEFMPFCSPDQKIEDDETLNLFDGFQHEYEEQKFQEEPKELKIIFDHIRLILANNIKDVGQYIINWLAFMLRYPAKKPKVACIFKSDKEQAGKNIFFEHFAKHVMGEEYYVMLTDMEQLTGGFNIHRRAKKLVLCNELANYAGYKASDKLKSFITDEDAMWTKKGIDSAPGKDYACYVFLTNNPNTVRIGLNDCRYMCSDISNDRVGDKKYFRKLSKCFKEHGQLFFDYLTNLDLSKVDITTPPATNFKRNMMWETVPVVYKFLGALGHDELHDEHMIRVNRDKPTETLKIKNKELFTIFKSWALTEFPYDKTIPSKFVKDMAAYGFKKQTIRTADFRGHGYALSYDALLNGMRIARKEPEYAFNPPC
jgi:hypothetical protein